MLWEHVLFIPLWLDTGSKVGQGRGGGGEGSGSLDDMKRFYFILQEIQRHEGLELGRNMIISELFFTNWSINQHDYSKSVHAKIRMPVCTVLLPLGKLGYGSQPLQTVVRMRNAS